jgi:hypothetical protein
MSELEATQELTRAEIAAYLREFADRLDASGGGGRVPGGSETTLESEGRKVTIVVGNDSATVNPPETLTFDIVVDSDSSLMGSDKNQRVTFGLRWPTEAVEEDTEIQIQ